MIVFVALSISFFLKKKRPNTLILKKSSKKLLLGILETGLKKTRQTGTTLSATAVSGLRLDKGRVLEKWVPHIRCFSSSYARNGYQPLTKTGRFTHQLIQRQENNQSIVQP